jgi:hypothetical protein
MRPFDEAVAVVVIVPAKNEVEHAVSVLGEFIVVWLTLVADADDDLGAGFTKLRDELLGGCAGRLVDEVGGQTVNGCEPLALTQADEADLDAIGGCQHVRSLGVAQGHVLAQGWVKDVGEEPRELAFAGEMTELFLTKVEVVVLCRLSQPSNPDVFVECDLRRRKHNPYQWH